MDTSTPLDLELVAMKQVAARARSAAARWTWRAAMQRRASRVAVVLGAVTKSVRLAGVHRAKVRGGWKFYAGPTPDERPIVTVNTFTPARSVEQLADLVLVRVHHAGAVDLGVLGELEHEGLVRLLVDGAAT